MTKSFVCRVLLSLLLALTAGVASAWGGTISVAWDPASDADLAGYRVYYGTAPGSYDGFDDVGLVTSHTLTGLSPCTRYYIAVKAYDDGGLESANYSNQIEGLPRPVVSSSQPPTGEQGASITLQLSGESFASGASVEFSGTGITVDATRFVSCNELSVDISIAAGAAVGARDVTVINPDRSFGTGAGLFTVTVNQAPTVSSTDPPAGATAVPVTVRPVVTFSERMDPASITATNVRLLDAAGSPVAQAAASPSLSADGLRATITPAADLAHGSTFRIRVAGGTGGVRDALGKEMAADWEQNPGFTTADQPDTQGPRVTGSTPAAGATGVAVSVTPELRFDEALDPASVTAQTVRLLDAAGDAVPQAPGSPTLSPDGTRVTLTPASALAELATYRLQALGGPSGVKDLAGNPMTQDWTQTPGFTTENLPPGSVAGLHRTDVR